MTVAAALFLWGFCLGCGMTLGYFAVIGTGHLVDAFVTGFMRGRRGGGE
jgi:hypothetical protein